MRSTRKDDDNDARDRVCEILVVVLEQSGVWHNHDEESQSAWNLIADSLENLSQNIEKLTQTSQNAPDLVGEVLLSIEENAKQVRSHSVNLIEEQESVSDSLHRCTELEAICFSGESERWLPLALALSTAIRRQRLETTDCLQKIEQYLKVLYKSEFPSDAGSSDLVRSLRKVTSALSTRCIDSNESPWKDARDVVRGLTSVNQEKNLVGSDGGGNPIGMRMQVQSVTPASANVSGPIGFAAKADGMIEKNSIVDAALAFAGNQDPVNANTCFLMVGGEGSGKTFCLDQIEKEVAQRGVQGKP